MLIAAAVVAVVVIVGVVLALTLSGGDDDSADQTRPTNQTTPTSSASTTPSTAAPTTASSAVPTTTATTSPGPSSDTVSVSTTGGAVTSAVAPGASVEISASGFEASSPVTVTLRSDPVELGTVTADASGQIKLTVDLPKGVEPGTHTIEVSGVGPDGEPRVVSTQIEIVDAELPNTGPRRRLLFGGAALLVAGLAMVLFARPRRRATL